MEKITDVLKELHIEDALRAVTQLRAEEDGRPYQVWKLDTDRGSLVLKQTSPEEREVYEAFFSEGGPAPKVYAFGQWDGKLYMLMEFAQGTSMSRCSRIRLQRTLDALITSQERYWDDQAHGHVGYCFDKSWPNRCKRLEYMGDLSKAYQVYLEAFRTVPRTLCNDDMLPFNVLADDERAVILDWEYAGILPYPCALARLIAFGEEEPGTLFYMTEADRQFALDYYYEKLIRSKGISRADFDRTMGLFLFKEYSEWVYCAGLSGDYEMDYYKKYSVLARDLARKLGLL